MDEPRINHVASLCSSLGVKYVLEKLPTGWRYLAEPFSMLCLPFSNASKIASAIESKKSKAVSPTMEEPIKKIVKGKVAKKSDSLKVNPKDFFGRDLQLEDSAQQQVVFKYKEGYLNAVRKPISMSDLFIKIVQRHSHTP